MQLDVLLTPERSRSCCETRHSKVPERIHFGCSPSPLWMPGVFSPGAHGAGQRMLLRIGPQPLVGVDAASRGFVAVGAHRIGSISDSSALPTPVTVLAGCGSALFPSARLRRAALA